MIYRLLKVAALRAMKTPIAPPEPPPGDHTTVQVYRASPGYLSYRLLGFWIGFSLLWVGGWLLVAVGLSRGDAAVQIFAAISMVGLAVVQFCVYFAIRIDYEMRYYVVTERSLRVREGAFLVKEMTISFANVQNIRGEQGPLMRLFKIQHLCVETAGGGSAGPGHGSDSRHRVRMAGIENADQVRDYIQQHLRSRSRDAGLGDPDDRGASPVAASSGASMIEALRELREATADLRKAV